MANFMISVKAAQDGARRIVRGWATRPEEDRDGDIVVPTGVQYRLPIPFLLDHDAQKAIGSVDEVSVSSAGIQFVASVRKIGDGSEVARACDNAWALLQNGLRSHVSVGFRTLAHELLPSRGMKITEWEWLELSAVTIPALASAEITALKNYGTAGKSAAVPFVRLSSPQVLPAGCFHLVR